MTRVQLERSISSESPHTLSATGKVYVYGDIIFLNERYEGVHVINNTDPSKPINKCFIRIPGCMDIAVKGNVLYADNARDLVAIDISDPMKVNVLSRTTDIFPEIEAPDGLPPFDVYQEGKRPPGMVVVGWKQ